MITLGKITLASCGLGLTVLLAGGSMSDKSTPAKTFESLAKVVPVPTVHPAKAMESKPVEATPPNFAAVFQTNPVATESINEKTTIAVNNLADDQRRLIIDRLQTITR